MDSCPEIDHEPEVPIINLNVSDDAVEDAEVPPPNYTRFSFLCLGIGLVAQALLYTTFTSPYAFYSDTFTTAIIQTTVNTVIMNICYFMFFRCKNEKITIAQRIGSVFLVSSFVLATSYRLPVPLAPIVVAVLGKSTYDSHRGRVGKCGVYTLRTIVTIGIVFGASAIIVDAIVYTNAGIVMLDEVKNSAAVLTGYIVVGAGYFVGVWFVQVARTESMHTGSIVRNGFTYSLPIMLVVYALSFIPGYGDANTRFSPDDTTSSDDTQHMLLLFGASTLKLVIVACLVESIKLGELFSFSAFSALPYFVFVFMTASSRDGMLPPMSAIGIVLISCSLLIVVAVITVFSTRFSSEGDVRCRACKQNKDFLWGLAWRPRAWFDTESRYFDLEGTPMRAAAEHAHVRHEV